MGDVVRGIGSAIGQIGRGVGEVAGGIFGGIGSVAGGIFEGIGSVAKGVLGSPALMGVGLGVAGFTVGGPFGALAGFGIGSMLGNGFSQAFNGTSSNMGQAQMGMGMMGQMGMPMTGMMGMMPGYGMQMGSGMGMMSGMGGMGGYGGYDMAMQQQMMMMQMMMMMMMQQQMMQQQMSGMGMGMNMGNMGMNMGNMGMGQMNGFPSGMFPMTGGISNFMGVPGGMPSYGYPQLNQLYSNGTQANPGSGQAAVDLARQFTGQESWRIKGQMPNFTAAGGQTNNCADFVSSALESTGRLQGHHINVSELEQSLLKQGYVQVSADQAKPGDVWISNSRGHTELVSQAGGGATIGSNNDRPGHQVISERQKGAGTGVYYQKRN